MEVLRMKKYNTPEMKVSIFNSETVLTDSTHITNFDTFYETATAKTTVKWNDIMDEVNITF